MPKTLAEIKAEMPPERQDRIAARTAELIREEIMLRPAAIATEMPHDAEKLGYYVVCRTVSREEFEAEYRRDDAL